MARAVIQTFYLGHIENILSTRFLKCTIFLFLWAMSSVNCFAGVSSQQSVAQESSVIIEGKARFTILTPHLIRIEWSDSGQFEDKASLTFVNRSMPVTAYSIVNIDNWLELNTSDLKLRYRKNSSGFNSKTLNVSFLNGEEMVTWYPGLNDDKNLLGTTRTVDGYEGTIRHSDGKKLELEHGLISQSGWSLIDDSETLLFKDKPLGNEIESRKEGNSDWYLFAHGRDYKSALNDFAMVSGKIPLPPKFAFGYWWSRYWAYSDSELRDLIKDFRTYDIPLDVLIIDMDWHETHGLTSINPETTPFQGMLGWTGYTWNKSLFPEPESFLNWTNENNLQVALNLHPADGISPMENSYKDMNLALGSNSVNSGDWIEYKLSDPQWSEAYFDTVIRPHEFIGVDFWWLDWQQWPTSKFAESLSNTFWLNHSFFKDMERQYPEKRPLIFHRWGGLGNHRYQVGFSGDAIISWKSLAYQPYFTATASNVGYGYWSHDIGGHIDAYDDLAKNGELYLRWIQYGALSPVLRTHSSKSDVAERRIWKYPDYFEDMRAAIQRRYSLFPVFYGLAREAHDTGVSITRPMYYEYPNEEAAYSAKQQFMLGTNIIVAPVTTPSDPDTKLAKNKVWLPEGDWYEWDTGYSLKGGREVTRLVALSEVPIYLRAGTVLTMLPGSVKSLQSENDAIELTIVPGKGGDAVFYEDDGVSQEYLSGNYAKTKVNTIRVGSKLIVNIAAAEGSYKNMANSRQWSLRILGVAPAASVYVNGKKLSLDSIEYEATAVSALINLPRLAKSRSHKVEIKFDSSLEGMAIQLDGKVGQFKRLKKFGELVKLFSARDDWAATTPNKLLQLIETPQRLQYRLDDFNAEIKRFEESISDLKNVMHCIPQITPAEAKSLTHRLAFNQ